MMKVVILVSAVTSLLLFMFFSFNLFLSYTRFNVCKLMIKNIVMSFIFKGPLFMCIYCLCLGLCLMNFVGNFPLMNVLPFFYGFTFWLSFFFWLPIMISALVTNSYSFFSHLLPFGSPVGLMFFLPLVELISQLIRPFTLMVRLSTNLAAGHMMLYIFSYFTLLSEALVPMLSIVLLMLFMLEIFISLLQAYIFVTLLMLYKLETL